MTLHEKVVYLQGMTAGLKLEASSDLGLLMNSITDILSQLAREMADTEVDLNQLGTSMDEVKDRLDELEVLVEDELDEEDGEEAGGAVHTAPRSTRSEEADGILLKTRCPACYHRLLLSPQTVAGERTQCPFCGEMMEIYVETMTEGWLDEDDDEDEDDDDDFWNRDAGKDENGADGGADSGNQRGDGPGSVHGDSLEADGGSTDAGEHIVAHDGPPDDDWIIKIARRTEAEGEEEGNAASYV